MAKRDSGLAVVAEPYRIPPNHPYWAVDYGNTIAIVWRKTRLLLPYQTIRG